MKEAMAWSIQHDDQQKVDGPLAQNFTDAQNYSYVVVDYLNMVYKIMRMHFILQWKFYTIPFHSIKWMESIKFCIVGNSP